MTTRKTKKELIEIATDNAKLLLKKLGIKPEFSYYDIKFYELEFAIYRALKEIEGYK